MFIKMAQLCWCITFYARQIESIGNNVRSIINKISIKQIITLWDINDRLIVLYMKLIIVSIMDSNWKLPDIVKQKVL